jgi:hypothetical protein
MPPDYSEEERKKDGETGTHEREILVNAKEEQAHRRDPELYPKKERLPMRDQRAHERVQLHPASPEVHEGEKRIQDLKEKDGKQDQPHWCAKAVDVVAGRIGGSSIGATPATHEREATYGWCWAAAAVSGPTALVVDTENGRFHRVLSISHAGAPGKPVGLLRERRHV